jgi:predicted transcriptional regulator
MKKTEIKVKLSPDLNERVSRFSEHYKLDKNDVIENAIEYYLGQFKNGYVDTDSVKPKLNYSSLYGRFGK